MRKSDNRERHQFCFSFMRGDTGGQKTKTFWGDGDPETAKKDCIAQAKRYATSYEGELNQKARDKAYRRGDRYAPSHIDVQIVGSSMWR